MGNMAFIFLYAVRQAHDPAPNDFIEEEKDLEDKK